MKLKIALDWTPNVIHAGLLWAMHQGLFEKAGLEIDYISTEVDNYTQKPIQRLINGEADICIGPSEHLFHFVCARQGEVPAIQAFATVMQGDMSAFVVKESSGIASPALLDGKRYAGYQTPLEQEILAAMIQAAGGKGQFERITPPRLEVWRHFMEDQADCAWVFLPWEGALAEAEGVALQAFQPHHYGVPYGYSTLLFAQKESLEVHKEAFVKLRKVLEQGYREAAQKPQEVAAYLCDKVQHPNFAWQALIEKAMEIIAPSFLNEQGHWGLMEMARFKGYLHWLQERGLSPYQGNALESFLWAEGLL